MIVYDVTHGALHLEHCYPPSLQPRPRVAVDIQLILETVKSTELQPGTWLNVIGYVRRPIQRHEGRRRSGMDDSKIADDVDVQAVMLWNAGAIKVGDYEANIIRQRGTKKLASGMA